jgi:pimeloyl-ACP methyl ester carboxylesterase
MRRFALFLMLTALAHPAAAQLRERQPVKFVAPTSIGIPYAGGTAQLPVYASLDWTQPQAGVTRGVIVIHGLLRNADAYFAGARRAQEAAGPDGAGAIMVSPQFLADFDLPAHNLAQGTLGWTWDRWARGEPAVTPAPISTFTGIDAVVERLANPALFPNLKTIVVAGFSAGGQVVQRYAVVGQAEQHLRPGVAIEYVVSDPSSYLYFTASRPEPAIAATCPAFNDWHYGFGRGIPPYVQGTAETLEARYIQRHVTYLLGMADTDPNHPVLDKSCAGEAEGPQRFARGHNYWDMLVARHGAALKQSLIDVPGIAHEGNKMFNTACGLHVLFGKAGC